jgi:hypothetical protein
MKAALAAALVAASLIPSSAAAVQIHRHVHRTLALPDTHEPVKVQRTLVVSVAPADSDDDGCRNSQDSYLGPGCDAPEVVTPVTPAPVAATGSCPASLAGESSSPTAVNPASQASGCIQALPSTWTEFGDPAYASAADAPVPVQMEALARICAAQGNDAWVAADPC